MGRAEARPSEFRVAQPRAIHAGYRSIPFLHLRPKLLEWPIQSATDEDLEEFVASRIGMVGPSGYLHAGEVLAIPGSIAAQHDHAFAGVLSWPPIPIVLMIADRLRQPILFPEEIDRSRLTITVGKNRSHRALLRREFIVNPPHCLRHFLPSKLIGKMLRQRTGRLVLGLGRLEVERLLITDIGVGS